MEITTILFDLDGTLVDSAQETALILNQMRSERGYPPLNISFFREKISHGAPALIECALDFCEERTADLINEFRLKYKNITTPESSLYPMVKNTLNELKKRNLKLGICTNKPENLCNKVLKDTGIIPYFDSVISQTPSMKLKPNPEPVNAALTQLETTAKNTILVGDSTVDQRTCQATNIPFIFFKSGYNDGIVSNQIYASITHISELLNFDIFSVNTLKTDT